MDGLEIRPCREAVIGIVPPAGRDRAKGEKMSDPHAGDGKRKIQYPSNKGFFIFMACCALGAVALIALLISGEIQGPRVAPDIAPKATNVD